MVERMACWVVTGPAGAGKSRLVSWLVEQGAVAVDADSVGHQVLEEPEVLEGVRTIFGLEVIRGGAVDRKTLGRRVFADPAALARLNALTHPRLVERVLDRLAELENVGTALAVVEAAVYFRWPPLAPVDLVIAVVADPAVRLARLRAAGLDETSARQRIAAQESMAADWPRADVLLVNEGRPADLFAAARRVLGEHWRQVPHPRDDQGERT
jgi:dephospho-CoA kinase